MKADSRRYYEILGRRLAALRTSRGFTQVELARRIEVSQQAIFSYEIASIRVPIIVLDNLATLYGLSVEEVMGRVPERHAPKRRLSPRAMRHAERIQAMSKTAQRFIVRIIDQIEAMGWDAPKRKPSTPDPVDR